MKEITIVAEMACAHEGSVDTVIELTKVAAKAKVDVIQYHFAQVDENAVVGQPNYDLGQKLQIPLDEYERIFNCARENKLKIIATTGDVISARQANRYKPDMWRIHSSDINNLSLIKYLCETNIPLSFGVGGSTIEEIEYAISNAENYGGKIEALIHGFQGYPTPIDEVNLAFIKTLKDKFKITVGYQDHTDGDDPLGFTIPAMALCFGAEIIEKHFTLDRSKKGIDYHASLNPDELQIFAEQIRQAYQAIGYGDKKIFGKSEQVYRKNFKKGFVFRNDIPMGKKIDAGDLKMVRIENLEILGTEIKKIVGKVLTKDVSKNQIVRKVMLK